jgi:hypothetical protein
LSNATDRKGRPIPLKQAPSETVRHICGMPHIYRDTFVACHTFVEFWMSHRRQIKNLVEKNYSSDMGN